eukprot:TRINITY_DN14612_c0_g1_i4.p1 TRINITY_DN14612_c0_g1~~TRINITY_DN14612_c0_g1_i4.p1  ORF type:complete len:617 (+),score=180.34 TRINITY_DN14612_c0_g1_i4:167-2017(+)
MDPAADPAADTAVDLLGDSEKSEDEEPAAETSMKKKFNRQPTNVEAAMVKVVPGGMTSELFFAQIDAKVAEHCTRLVEPHLTISKANSSQLVGLWSLSKENSARLTKLDHMLRDMQEGLLQITRFREELDNFRTKQQQQEAEERAFENDIKMEMQNLNMAFSKKDEALQQQDARLTHLTREVARMREVLDTTSEAFHKSLEEKLQQMGSMKANLEIQVAGVEMKHNRLVDQVWQDETALARLSSEIRHFKLETDEFKQVVAEFQKERDAQGKLHKLQTELVEWLGQTRFELSDTRKQVADGLEQAKSSMKLGLQIAADQVANFMVEVRDQTEKHLQTYAAEREGTEAACAKFEAELKGFADNRSSADKRIKGIIQELQEGTEEESRRRKRERASLETELKTIGEHMVVLFKSVEGAVTSCKAVEPLCEAVLQAAEMQLSLEKQDAADWAKASLVGYKSTSVKSNKSMDAKCNNMEERMMSSTMASTAGTSGSFSTFSSPAKSPRRLDTSGVVTLDKECFSCSTQREMVLTGFKMACLHYNPSPVKLDRYESEPLSRAELFARMEATLAEGRHRMNVLRGEPQEESGKRSPSPISRGSLVQPGPQKTFTLPALSPRR